jgi:C4-dicarboxylate-specific signal transduction histidine kinase
MTPQKLEGQHCWEIWHMRTEPCTCCPVILARDTGKQQEAEIRGPDGRHWYIRGFPIKDDDGRVKGVVEFCLDITERKLANEEIEALNTHLASHALELEQAREDLEKRVAERTADLARIVDVLTNEVHERRQVEKNLKDEIAVKLQTMEKLRMKDQLLMQQSRQAAMGEMIGNIAHQWRQPLNNIGLLVQELQLRFEWEDLTQQDMDLLVQKSMEMISHMSQTIDDFRNFFRPEKEKVMFPVSQVVSKTLSLIGKSLKNQGIDIFFEHEGDPLINGFPNEF